MKILLSLFLFSNILIACPDGTWSVNPSDPRQMTKRNMTFEVGRIYTYCVKIPQVVKPHLLIEWPTVNKGNSSCADLKMIVIEPNKKRHVSFGSQPGVVATYAPGMWKVKFKLRSGCNVFDGSANF